MLNTEFRLSFRYRMLFYVGGFVFATTSYVAGLLAYGAESASWGDTVFYQHLVSNLINAFQSHTLTFFAWQLICTAMFITIGYLFDKEVYYRKKAEQKANVDGLTEIYNHRYFQDRLSAEIERAERYGRTLSVIMLDLDNFKQFNDTWGHQEGDRLLRWFSDLCNRCVRNIDILARYGGEEFVVILPETDLDETLAVAQRIRSTMETESGAMFGHNKRTTISAGIAGYPHHARTRHSLILDADAALYYAKQQGKNRCEIYEEKCRWTYRAVTEHVKALFRDDAMGAIEALSAMVDARDANSRGHSVSVMNLSVALGEKIGLAAEEIENIRAAALLHDLGKICTPEEVLEKNGPLGSDEWKLIEDHARMGSNMLTRFQQLGSIIPGVKHHHERYDGQGYPSGYSGDNIPLMARIIAIADAFDAMTNARSYKPAKSAEDATEELMRCAGVQFDPNLVSTFVEMIQDTINQEAA